MIPELDLSKVDIRVRAQFLKHVFSRIAELLKIHSEDYLLILSEQVDEAYIKLRRIAELIVDTAGFEELQRAFPDQLPESLHSLDEDADIAWDYIRPAVNSYKGQILQFCVDVGAKYTDGEPFETLLKSFDKLIDAFRQSKRQEEQKWLARVEKQAEPFRAQAETKTQTPTLPSQNWDFVGDDRLRTLLSRDYAELGELLKAKAPKSTLVLCGSILEAVLAAILRKQEQAARALGIPIIALLSSSAERQRLRAAGASEIYNDLSELLRRYDQSILART